MAIKIQHSIRTLRLKVKTEGYAWLNKAAIEVNMLVVNILSATRLPPSVSGNESSFSVAEPSEMYSRCAAGLSAMKAAAWAPSRR
jgi:hypothetical protein